MPAQAPGDRVVVIGASLGGIDALQQLVARLPASFPAPIVLVQHIGAHPSVLPDILSTRGPLPAVHARDGQRIAAGHLYLAPPDRHVLLDGSTLHLSKGPKEHHSRPAIDPLFRTAALSRGADVIGVVLTGLLTDGTAGLQAIKQCGGVAVVQDPGDAVAPSMPAAALRAVDVDHCATLAELAPLLLALLAERTHDAAPDQRTLAAHEQALFLLEGDAMEHLEAIGTPSTFACPDCKGVLWEIANARPTRYRCHTGHAFTLLSLEQTLTEALDTSLWSAIRALQEKAAVLRRVAGSCDSAHDRVRATAADDARSLSRHADVLRKLLERLPPTGT